MVAIAILSLHGPVDRLAALYGTHFSLVGLRPAQGFALIAISAFLGWLGSRIAVGRHLDHTFS